MSAVFGLSRGAYGANQFAAIFDVVDSRYRAGALGFLNVFAGLIGSLAPIGIGCLSQKYGNQGFEWGFAALGGSFAVAIAALLVAHFVTYRLPGDKYNLEIADNVAVTITMTYQVRNKVTNLIGNDGMFNPPDFKGSSYDGLVLGETKMTVKMTIRNASDEELGKNAPEFTIDDIRQEDI